VRAFTDVEQVDALVTGMAWSLAFSTFHTARPTAKQIASLFTISPGDVRRLVRERDDWLSHVRREAGSLDGLYVLPLPAGGYETYEQERGAKFDRKTWKTLEDASAAWIEILIRRLDAITRA
jgi:hypothetical protein